MASAMENQLTAQQEQAIAALLTEPTVTKVAAVVGVSDRTVHRWLDDPAFSAAYRHARKQVFQQAMSLTQKYVPYAVQALAKVMSDAGAPHSAKVSAASALLKFSREAIEIDDLQARLEDLEQKIDAKPKRVFADEPWQDPPPPPEAAGSTGTTTAA